MTDLIASIVRYFKNKASTTLFAVYISFWAILHSEGIIALLFTKQDYIYEKYNLLKNEYLYEYFFGFHPQDIFWWAKTVTPFILTILYINYFARFILNPSYEKEIKYRTDRKISKAKEEIRYQKERNKLDKTLVEKEKNKTAIKEAQQRQEQADPTIKWQRDYTELSITQDIDKIIMDFKDLIYSHNRHLFDGYGNPSIDVQSLTACESYGLFTRDPKNNSFVEVTDKGWYFIRKHG